MIAGSFSLDDLTAVVRAAGAAILRVDPEGSPVEEKGDGSPLTAADRAAHDLLQRELAALLPGVPVLSEESPEDLILERKGSSRFWLVDPLDGTKEFLKGTGEYTVNVALVESGRTVAGVVHAPVLGVSYRAGAGSGAERAEGEGPFHPIHARPFRESAPVLIASRDHAGPGVRALANALGDRVEFARMGSSLKFCLLAEGSADLYLRDLPTMEWDTGAGQCVLEAAGGAVLALESGRETASLRYNKESLRNPPLLAVGEPAGPWRELLHRAGLGA